MKLECVKDKLKDAVVSAERVTGKNLTLPILSAILFIASGKTLKLRATNLDLGIEVEIPAKIDTEGVTAVSGTVIGNFLSIIYGSTSVELESLENSLSLSTTQNSTVINTFPYDDFPTLPSVVDGYKLCIPIKNFIGGMRSVVYAASVSDIKPELSSVYIYTDSNNIVFVATDSFRLAERRIPFSVHEEIASLLIPHKNIIEIIRIFDNKTGDVEVSFNTNQISLTHENIYLTSRVIDGIFPDYKQIVPKDFTTEVVVLKQDLINALKVSNVFSDKFNQITFNVNPAKKLFELNSKNADVGENTARLDAAIIGEPVSLSFNHRSIIDSFQSIDKDSVALHFNGEGKPLVIKPVGDTSFTYLVMPISR